MSLLSIPNTFAGDTKAYAAEVNQNFQEVAAVINGNLDSENLMDLGIGGDKIAGGAITTAKLGLDSVDHTIIADDAVRTAHILDANVTEDKIANDAIVESKMNWDKSEGGVKALRMGPSTTNFGLFGLLGARIQKSVTPADGWVSVSINFGTDALDGDPQYLAAPFVLGWSYYTTGVDANRPVGFGVSAIDATTATIKLKFASPTPTGGTLSLFVCGPPTVG